MKSAIEQFLLAPDNFEIALDIAARIEELRRAVYSTFWSNVAAVLEDRLHEADLNSRWTLYRSPDVTDRWSVLAIASADDPGLTEKLQTLPSRFTVRAEALSGNPTHCSYGVHRGHEVTENLHPLDRNLSEALSEKGFKPYSGWSGNRSLERAGLPRIDNSNEALLLLNEDNHNHEARPLARQVAEVMWDLFFVQREKLEQLNSSYPY